ncbi:tRNA pseudouridine synthase A [Paeniglutamicibacter sulfureus]|uniref:tRNA pseudouridine synthase A n=1 Tax=Paeniglutamicibacter sulfureus TaxID=43666 RepID=UPI00266701BD|nr:tRNA pseudouridine synthase A [Paeniglutamicibacter sulfureus]MDO2935522.1 tRNA pseudouridine synthase A [Paeniglutamicibacter sulfureus]
MNTSPIDLRHSGLAPDGGATEPATVRLAIRIGYDGTAYNGWALQPALPTVQGVLEAGLSMLIRRNIRTVVAGRTDAGVHARNQIAHFDLTPTEVAGLARGSGLEPGFALLRRLRGVLGRENGAVLVHDVWIAPDGFDARFSALWRRYSYRIADGPARFDPLTRAYTMWHKTEIDVGLLNSEAVSLLGRHDFLSFCKPREHATTIRTLTEFSFVRDSEGIIVAHLKADAFCHNMVRAMIGACIKVGDGRETPGWVARRLAEAVRDSRIMLADPRALVLEEVAYPLDDHEIARRAELTRTRRKPDDITTDLPELRGFTE